MDYSKLSKIVDAEASEYSPMDSLTVAKEIQESASELEAWISKTLGAKIQLTPHYAEHSWGNYLTFQSQDLMDSVANSTMDALAFRKVYLYTGMGEISRSNLENGYICFDFNFRYVLKRGGENGCEIPGVDAYWDIKTSSWVFGREEAEKRFRR